MSMDTSMEEDSDSYDSNTEAIVCGTSDHSGESMISGPNITSSSSSDDDYHHQQISTAAGGSDTEDLIVSSSASSSSWFTNNNKQIDQEPTMIFNVDFRALSSRDAVCNNSSVNEVANVKPEIKNLEEIINSDSYWKNELVMMKEVSREQLVLDSIWDFGDEDSIFEVPPLSPLEFGWLFPVVH